MPIRGPQLFQELQRAQSRIHQAVAALEESSRNVDERMDQFVSQRSDEFLELARHYLPDISMETVERSFVGVRDELVALLKKKQAREQELLTSIERAEKAIDEDTAETDRVTEKLNEKAKQRDELQEVVANRLKGMQEYVDLSIEAAKAEQRLTANEQRLEQVEQESSQKLPSYDNSRLFKYLYDRNFGTGNYEGAGFIRRMDRRLARFIGYSKARQSYQFLKMTPKLMAAEIERRRHQFNELMGQIEALEAQIEKEVGLPEVIAVGEQLGELRDNLVLKIDDQNRQLESYFTELKELRESSGKYYGEALTMMKKNLEESEEIVLRRRAAQTTERQDDEIVSDIVELNRLIGELQPEIATLVERRGAMTQRQGGFDEIVRRFRSSNYDSHRSVFAANFDLDSLVERFINGELNVRSAWRVIRKNQRFEESWAQRNGRDIIQNPSGQIIMHTMLDIVSEALKNSARRGVHRRNSGGVFFPGGSSGRTRRRRSSSRKSNSRRRSSPRRRSGGFTTGEGF